MINAYNFEDYFSYYKKWTYRNFVVDCLTYCTDYYYSDYKKTVALLHHYNFADLDWFRSVNVSLIKLSDYEVLSYKNDCINRTKSYLKKLCFSFSHYNEFMFYLKSLTTEDFAIFQLIDKKSKECPRLFAFLEKKSVSRSKTISRIRARFNSILQNSDNVYFITMTFNDNTFKRVSKETRRVYVRRILKKFSFNYLANIDFGGMFGREHYHAIAVINDFKSFWNEYYNVFQLGSCRLEKVTNSKKSVSNLSNYINKLVLHCVKSSADRIIYSRS